METFLDSVARRIYNEQKGNTGSTLVVFNNRRAGLFMRNRMAALGEKAFFLPQTMGIDELVSQLSGLEIIPQEMLIFELFNIHRSLEGAERRFETLEEFLSFGEMMLNDFSEIDLYCIPAEQLFSNVYADKQLQEWDPSKPEPTPFQEKYLNFYRSLHTYYTRLRSKLYDDGQAYSGMAYRHVAEHVDSITSKLHYNHIYFVGFNALSTSEETIIHSLTSQNLATLICDGDRYYYDDERQEAGFFLRNHKNKFDIDNFGNNFADRERHIHIVNCPENTLQAKAAGVIIEREIAQQREAAGETDKVSLDDFAIVLADEKLLLPALNALPADVTSLNVTMGFPYNLTGVHALANTLMEMHLHKRDNRFHNADIVALLSSTIISKMHGIKDLHSIVARNAAKDKTIFASFDDILRWTGQNQEVRKIEFLFDQSADSVDDMLCLLRKTAETILESDALRHDTKEKEALASLMQLLDYFDQLQEDYKLIDKTETLQRLYQRLAQRRSVAFYGKPLQGLQLLGMLETRNLDFRKIIITSVNEGTLPTGRGTNSLIPYSLKCHFGIPTHKEKDAVYAYNFYRLIQRAETVWLLFSSDAEGMGKGEPSRYIMQLRDELSVLYPNVKIHEHVLSAPNSQPDNTEEPSAAKDAKVMQRLDKIAQNGFSPSALNRYRNCPMQFYFHDILGVHEMEEANEDLETNELGTLIHKLLQDIYSRDGDRRVSIATLKKALNETSQLVDKAMHEDFLKGRSGEGRNHLYGEVAKMQISNFLRREISLLEQGHSIVIQLTEEELTHPITTDNNQTVNIKGTTDRVDLFDGKLRIADYKSGKVSDADLKVKDREPEDYDIPDKWFQVMTYAWLYCRTNKYSGSLLSGIFPLRTLKNDFMPASWCDSTEMSKDDIDNFEQALQTLISEIMDPAIGFDAIPKDNACAYCPARRGCRNKIESRW